MTHSLNAADHSPQSGGLPASSTPGEFGDDVADALNDGGFIQQIAAADAESAEQLVASKLVEIEPTLRLASFGIEQDADRRVFRIEWADSAEGERHPVTITVPVNHV